MNLGSDDLVAAFSPDSDQVYATATGDDAVMVTFDTTSMRVRENRVFMGSEVSVLLPHPTDGSVIALAADGSFLRVVPDTHERLASGYLELSSRQDLVAALSPDGSSLALPDPSDNVRLLDLDRRRWIPARSQSSLGTELRYAPDGSQFASVQRGLIRLWDGQTGEHEANLPLPTRTADASISYLPDSTGLLVAATDGRTWTVDTRLSAWVKRACRIAGRNLTRAEWKQFFPNRAYQVACRQWPAPS